MQLGPCHGAKSACERVALLGPIDAPSAGRKWSMLGVQAAVIGPQNPFKKVQAGNQVSGPDFGRILVGKVSKSALRQTEGRPEADFDAFPIRIRPKSGPEARFPARRHYCVT